MAISITHATVAVGTDAGNGEIRKAQWNEAHTVTGVPEIFAQSGVAVSVGATTTETVLATVSFAGGELGPNGILMIWSQWTNNNNANNKTFSIRLGGAAGTLYQGGVNTTNVGQARPVIIANQNSQSAQRCTVPAGNQVGYGAFASAAITSTLNTAAAWDLVFTGTKAVAGDTLTLEGYQVLVCYRA